MANRRLSAKKIARSPALKRKIAEILAAHDENVNKITVAHVLAYGHRGFISYNEDDLCKMFDRLFTKKLAEVAEKKKDIESQKINPRRQWEVDSQKRTLEALETSLTKFREIADELFEAKFLL